MSLPTFNILLRIMSVPADFLSFSDLILEVSGEKLISVKIIE